MDVHRQSKGYVHMWVQRIYRRSNRSDLHWRAARCSHNHCGERDSLRLDLGVKSTVLEQARQSWVKEVMRMMMIMKEVDAVV